MVGQQHLLSPWWNHSSVVKRTWSLSTHFTQAHAWLQTSTQQISAGRDFLVLEIHPKVAPTCETCPFPYMYKQNSYQDYPTVWPQLWSHPTLNPTYSLCWFLSFDLIVLLGKSFHSAIAEHDGCPTQIKGRVSNGGFQKLQSSAVNLASIALFHNQCMWDILYIILVCQKLLKLGSFQPSQNLLPILNLLLQRPRVNLYLLTLQTPGFHSKKPLYFLHLLQPKDVTKSPEIWLYLLFKHFVTCREQKRWHWKVVAGVQVDRLQAVPLDPSLSLHSKGEHDVYRWTTGEHPWRFPQHAANWWANVLCLWLA